MSWWWVLGIVAVLLASWWAFCEWLRIPARDDPIYGDFGWDRAVQHYDELIRRVNPVAEEQFSNPSAVHVPGYKPQSEANLKIVKFHKEWEERTLRHLDWLKAQAGIDQRWLQIGRTDIEIAFMAVNRAVMQPGRIALPEDANPDKLEPNQQPYVAPQSNPLSGTTPVDKVYPQTDTKMAATFDKDGNLNV